MFLFCSYQHVFSGAKKPQQDEAKGGIIADEMGLGKSLVILSTVVNSLNRAAEFVAAENQLPSTEPSRKIPSGATLILAPSSRRCRLEALHFHLKIRDFD
jgi:SWI/SNF-related matrix-associated actin-dependent regulator of chromatin subfamily A3